MKDGIVTERESHQNTPKKKNKGKKPNKTDVLHLRQASMDPRVRFLDQWSDDQLMYYPVGKGERVLSEDNFQLAQVSLSMSDM